MRSFKDNKGRTWEIDVDYHVIRRVKGSELAVNLLDLVAGEGSPLVQQIIDDPLFLIDLLFVICRPQAEKLSISDEEFGKSIRGDVIDAATTALLEELADFFPAGKRRVLLKAVGKVQQLQARANEAAEQVLDSDRLDRALEQKLSSAFSNLPESSGSIPTA